MFVKQRFTVGLSDINCQLELTNTSLLKYLEDVANQHSEIAGFGISDINRVRRSWVLISWKVKIMSRPLINDTIEIKTASRKMERIYAFRDYEIYNNEELIGIATSKWIFVDIDNGKITKVDDEVANAYKNENDFNVFNIDDIEKLKEPMGLEIKNKTKFKVTKSLIDINKHMHNIYYINISKEVLPNEVSIEKELNDFEIYYKKEIKLQDEVNVYLYENEENYTIVIKSIDDEVLHAILKYKK